MTKIRKEGSHYTRLETLSNDHLRDFQEEIQEILSKALALVRSSTADTDAEKIKVLKKSIWDL